MTSQSPRHLSALRRSALLAVITLVLGTPCALADSVGGDCQYKGKTIAFRDGVVYHEANAFDDKKQDVVVALATIALDKAAIVKAEDKDDALRDQIWKADEAAKVELHIDQSTVTAMHYSGGGTSLSQSGSEVGKLSAKANDAKHVDAAFTLDGDGKDDMRCALNFNLSYGNTAAAAGSAKTSAAAETTAPARAGKPLPAGGGEAGKVFQANLAAMQKGDINGMLATVSKQQAEQMRAQQKDPQFAAMLGMMKAFAPKTATVTGGQDFGDSAELSIDAIDQSGGKSTGTSKLVKEDGKWKVEKTSMKSGPGG
ncbi:MAG: hypothetical protein ABI411_10785 [Tahibacter sp.]